MFKGHNFCTLTFIYVEQVLKVAILAEKYAVDYTWYVDTILNLIRVAGDYVSEEVTEMSPVFKIMN